MLRPQPPSQTDTDLAPRLWTCDSILPYQQDRNPHPIRASIHAELRVTPGPSRSLTFYPLPQILCRLLHSYIFNTDYQPLPRKATTMAEYLCEG